jgi:phage shock protein PspC (stress-responsive transcriptional regulator)
MRNPSLVDAFYGFAAIGALEIAFYFICFIMDLADRCSNPVLSALLRLVVVVAYVIAAVVLGRITRRSKMFGPSP